jgi:NitT/TauT family transport system permease protein
MSGTARTALDTLLLLVAMIVLWHLLHLVVGATALTSPAATLAHVGTMMTNERTLFAAHALETAKAFVLALVISYALGILLGIWLGVHKLAGAVAEPVLVALYALPKVTLFPVALLIFGLGMSGKVAFGVMHGVIPVAIFVMNAIRHVRPSYLKTAHVLKLSPLQTIWTVIVPATIPEIFTGLRVGFSVTLLGVLIGEMFASKKGLGFMVINAINIADVETVMAVALVLFVAAAIANGLLLWLDHRLHRTAAA